MIPVLSTFGHAESTVMTSGENLLDCGRTIYGDYFYSSVSLAEYLFDRKTHYCGTLRLVKEGRRRKDSPKAKRKMSTTL